MRRILPGLALLLTIVTQTVIAQKSDCGHIKEIKNTEGISCGFLEVPENHDVPKGRKIKIAYVILNAKNVKHLDDPVIYFSGGPGGNSIGGGFFRFLQNSRLRNERDIIFFDQRGINYSTALPDIGPDLFKVMAANAGIKQERKLIADVLRKYKQKAKAAGIELGDYNSFQNARDVGVLMNKLGYKKYNLFGISYGTRLARLIQDMFPEKVKTVTLDSPNLMTDDFLIDRMKGYSAAAEKVFGACEKDEACRSKYPNLKQIYESVIGSLKKAPLAVDVDGEVFHVNSQDGMYFLRRTLYRNNAKKAFPEFIEALRNAESGLLKRAIRNEKRFGLNTSMFLAVSVYESMDKANTPAVINKLYSTLPHFPEQLAFFTGLYTEGMNWHSKHLPVSERKFSKSDVPTLIFVNQYDPVTPPENGPLFQKKLTNSRLYILDVAGHSGGDFNCKIRVMKGFMDDPKSRPDSSCLKIFRGKRSGK